MAALISVVGLVALGGCGGTAGTTTTGPRAAAIVAGLMSSQATVRSADCRLWKLLDGSARTRLLAGMRSFFGGAVPGAGQGQILTDPRATRLFDGYCRLTFARAFKLYKLYARAAAFTPPAG